MRDMTLIKKLTAGVLFVAICAMLLYSLIFAVRHTFLSVNTIGDSGTFSVHIYDGKTGAKTSVVKLFTVYLVPRSVNSLIVTGDTAETVYTPPSKLSLFKASVVVNLQPALDATRLSSGSADCPFTVGATVFSYDCTAATSLKKYEPQPSGVPRYSMVAGFEPQHNLALYKNGILSLQQSRSRQGGHSTVTYVSDSGSKDVPIPGNIDTTSDYVQIITDTTNRQNSGFVVYDYNTGDAYYYKDLSGQVTPIVVKRQRAIVIAAGEVTSCTLHASTFTCYNGVAGPDSEDGTEDSGSTGSYTASNAGHDLGDRDYTGPPKPSSEPNSIQITKFTDKATTVTYSNSTTGINRLLATKDGTIFASSGYELTKVIFKDTTFALQTISHDSRVMTASGTSIYYLRDGGVYQYDDSANTASLRYRNKAILISNLIGYDNDLLLVGTDSTDPLQLLNAYRLKPSDTNPLKNSQ